MCAYAHMSQVLVYGDCAVNPTPSADELAQIAMVSSDTAAAFGVPPRVAMLSYSTLGSGAGPDVSARGIHTHRHTRTHTHARLLTYGSGASSPAACCH